MKKVIFVYNANSGLLSSIKDTVHKVASSKTYSCNLCKISFGAFSMKDKWKEFISGLKTEVKFLHKDEFLRDYGIENIEFPSAFSVNGKLKLLIKSNEINKCKNLDQLITLVKGKVK